MSELEGRKGVLGEGFHVAVSFKGRVWVEEIWFLWYARVRGMGGSWCRACSSGDPPGFDRLNDMIILY